MTVPEEKLAGVDQALAELGKSDEEISAVSGRFTNVEPADLQAVDAELGVLGEDVPVVAGPLSEPVEQGWDDENTEIEIIDESDFVLLVDEDDLEELEKVGEDDARRSLPPALPREGQGSGDADEDEEGDGFFKKLFSGRRSSNRPQ